MSSEWQEVSAAQFCRSVRDGTHDSPKPVEHGKSLVTSKHIVERRLDLSSAYKISRADFEQINARSKVDRWDVLISMIGTVGEPCLIREEPDFAIKNIGLFKSRGELEGKWLYYCLCSRDTQQAIRERSRGTTQAYIPLGALRDLPVMAPADSTEMLAIVEILDTLDCRIDNLRQTNATLEAIAAALFKSWFVDFNGVAAQDMQESELGLIPKGWRVASLDAIADYLNGLAMQKFPPESDTEFLPVIKIAQLRAGNTQGADRASTRLKPEYIVNDGDVLFSWSGTLEVEVWTGGRGALNQHLFKITSSTVPKWVYYFATRHHLGEFRAIAAGKATTMGHIQRGHLAAAKIALPPPDTITSFDAVMAPVFEKIIINALQVRTLASLRDSLLPRLISGKLRIPSAEAAAT